MILATRGVPGSNLALDIDYPKVFSPVIYVILHRRIPG